VKRRADKAMPREQVGETLLLRARGFSFNWPRRFCDSVLCGERWSNVMRAWRVAL